MDIKNKDFVELNEDEISLVGGGFNTLHQTSVGAAVGFLAIAVGGAAMLTPVGMGVFLTASIFSSGTAIMAAGA